MSENIQFAKRCEEEGIIFIGPKSKHLDMFGDKVKARTQARLAQIPVIPGSDGPVNSLEEVKNLLKSMITRLLLKHPLGVAVVVCVLCVLVRN